MGNLLNPEQQVLKRFTAQALEQVPGSDRRESQKTPSALRGIANRIRHQQTPDPDWRSDDRLVAACETPLSCRDRNPAHRKARTLKVWRKARRSPVESSQNPARKKAPHFSAYLSQRPITAAESQLCRLEKKATVLLVCFTCKKEFTRRCSRPIGKRSFCSPHCYYRAIHNPNYRRDYDNGNYHARQAVKRYFHLRLGNVVHHKDGNCLNNELTNLAVFASQADHMNFHRGGSAKPIWDWADNTRTASTVPANSLTLSSDKSSRRGNP